MNLQEYSALLVLKNTIKTNSLIYYEDRFMDGFRQGLAKVTKVHLSSNYKTIYARDIMGECEMIFLIPWEGQKFIRPSAVVIPL